MLSQLDHPNICRIYDFVEDDEGDFLVLELIEGRGLNLAIADGMEPAEQMRVAEAVAQALVSAHSEGVVHRDLKPSNVMLTGDGGVKVLDFGLARPMDDSAGSETRDTGAADPEERTRALPAAGLPESGDSGDSDEDLSIVSAGSQSASERLRAGLRTRQGKVIGTPTYMSPEQARGEPITTASDMYSYGLLLQTMFTGKRPYPLELQRSQLLRRVREGDTLPVEGIDSEIAKVIESLKSKAPAARPTAVAVIESLRWVTDRPKRRLRRWALAGAVALVLAVGLTYLLSVQRERRIAVEARDEADRRRGQAEDLIGFMVDDLRKKLVPVGRLDILEDVGDKALEYFEAVEGEKLTDGELYRLARALTQVGEVDVQAGDLTAAMPRLEEALALVTALVEKDPENELWQSGLGQVHFGIGDAHWRQGDLELAEAGFRRYLAVAETLMELDPDDSEWRLELAYGHGNLAAVLQAKRDLAGALEHSRSGIEIVRELVEAHPENVLFHRELASLPLAINGWP